MTVEGYIRQQRPDHRRILRWLRQLILTSDPGIREKISWNVPFYTYRRENVFYLNVLCSGQMAVDLAFMHGNDLPDETGLLESRGRKIIKSLVIRDVTDPGEDAVRLYIQDALLLSDRSL